MSKEYDNRSFIDPDQEILRWEDWVSIRVGETSKLGIEVKRPPIDLATNLLEKVHEEKGRKIVLEHAQISKKPILCIRGGTLWEQPLRLKQKCNDNVYEVQRTLVEMGRPPIIEHVQVPEFIQRTEKGLTGIPERRAFPLLDRHYFEYREKRENDLKEKIQKIDPFRPDMKDLMIKGNRPRTPPPKPPPLPLITVSDSTELKEDDLSGVYSIRINNTLFIKDINGQTITHLQETKTKHLLEPCMSWTYYFNVPSKKAGRAELYLENYGTVSLRYCWKRIKRPVPFIPDGPYEQVFFFNKNEDALYPGQNRNILFTFTSDKPGIYNETWELCFLNICFFNSLQEKFVINLSGDAVENIKTINEKVEDMKNFINQQAIQNMIKDIVAHVITKATVSVEPDTMYPYKKMLLESDLFVMKNPVCFYHQTEVTKMQEMYAEMNNKASWDLSIATWRQSMMEKDFEDRMRYYQELKLSHRRLLKPWYEGESVKQQKYRTVKSLLGKLADELDKEYKQIVNVNLPSESDMSFNFEIENTIRNVFYLKAYDRVATTIETCAGVLSSLDLNRRIKFNLCQ